MFDLLGRKKLDEEIERLRSRVEELQEENGALALQIERREDKIRKLSAASQETSLSLKAAEQRITALLERDGRGERADDEEDHPAVKEGRSRFLSPGEMELLLDRLDASRSPGADLLSAYLIPGSAGEGLPPEVGDLVKRAGSDRGVAVFYDPLLFTIALVPPLPLKEDVTAWAGSFQTGALWEILYAPVLVVAAHAGETLLGLALGMDGFVEKAVVKSTVKGKHTKGGWSQRRFERLREEDIRQHADLVVEKLHDILKDRRSIPARAVISGDPALLKMIVPYLQLSVTEAKIGRFDRKNPDEILEEVYSFVLLRG
ncbi:Vms1/Ankzf1 family peptidyl-tRNA hydrolase [Candidatus Methanocrinis natronophilus]|uniref:Vms1/Ankzf1 family peptidyl-tRNA hydrolase n=1 Tax=Candidatus Methanocrinis natronophilus TaxID=3033396 RepID=A0ABT5XAG6_9EURY|nr:Vms1/Ankzf1 family peptidyl-tRNA hydrolase [Candidatus Methanocrinis natronophilus]MDF0591693.1 Vms1/Ankzf1 family peptidyl-tRNA hydrolase [Candidatus Methanocrinis natronophilus]